MHTRLKPELAARAISPFARVLVGIDSSPESIEAARQAATLAQGPITLMGAYDPSEALVGGLAPGVPAHLDERQLRETAARALAEAQGEIADTESSTEVYRGRPWAGLLAAIERNEATLVAVGSHGTGRALGIVIGSTATELIHRAPCSVLVARPTRGRFPRRIVVGVDGSDESVAAYEAAKALADRFEAKLQSIAAYLEDDIDPEAIEKLMDHRVQNVFHRPVDALVAASADADLVVVGSRGRRGIKALGSVSERVAHQGSSSVLIVRMRP
jgi:nucleotide-binding universal stress UspA family protein